ncbi:uncharacterized protein LOC131148430 [Malania oleifera]|uniref:uncharacterized protein LOC131148430 n=1 Tax=Malania oleifera TaxID=397392 RepID=UPI0025AE3B1F|nr:uncharacterized protein LOC131148430 [Malania oleifera]
MKGKAEWENYLVLLVVAVTSIIRNDSNILILNGENFLDWKDKTLLTLGCMDIDLALRIDKPAMPTESSPATYQLAYERWEKSNRLCIMFIKSHVCKSIRGSIPECDYVKDYIKAIEEQFVSSEKALASTLMNKLKSQI